MALVFLTSCRRDIEDVGLPDAVQVRPLERLCQTGEAHSIHSSFVIQPSGFSYFSDIPALIGSGFSPGFLNWSM